VEGTVEGTDNPCGSNEDQLELTRQCGGGARRQLVRDGVVDRSRRVHHRLSATGLCV
jgi:hypothetical protein